jgi:hypothetical protein
MATVTATDDQPDRHNAKGGIRVVPPFAGRPIFLDVLLG